MFVLTVLNFVAYWMLGASISSVLWDNKLSGYDFAVALVVAVIMALIIQ